MDERQGAETYIKNNYNNVNNKNNNNYTNNINTNINTNNNNINNNIIVNIHGQKNDLKNGLFCGYDDSFYGKPSSNLYSYYGVHFCTVNYLYITLKYFTVI